jgi:hypothetical protein
LQKVRSLSYGKAFARAFQRIGKDPLFWLDAESIEQPKGRQGRRKAAPVPSQRPDAPLDEAERWLRENDPCYEEGARNWRGPAPPLSFSSEDVERGQPLVAGRERIDAYSPEYVPLRVVKALREDGYSSGTDPTLAEMAKEALGCGDAEIEYLVSRLDEVDLAPLMATPRPAPKRWLDRGAIVRQVARRSAQLGAGSDSRAIIAAELVRMGARIEDIAAVLGGRSKGTVSGLVKKGELLLRDRQARRGT